MSQFSAASSKIRRRIVFAGDSITAGDALTGRMYPKWVDALSGYGHVTSNKGVSGDTSTVLLARFDADVINNAIVPNTCFINIGKNDVTNAVTAATTMTNIANMIEKCRFANIVPILSTVIPYGSGATFTTQQKTDTKTLNAAIKEYAARSGILCVDFYTLMVDPATDWIQAIYIQASDNLHPNRLGMLLMGGYILQSEVFDIFPLGGVALRTPNLVVNPTFSIDTNADGLPDSFTYNKSAGTTITSVLLNHPISGKMMKSTVTAADGASQYAFIQQIITGWNIADIFSFAADLLISEFTTNVAGENSAGVVVRLREVTSNQQCNVITYFQPTIGNLLRIASIVNITMPANSTQLVLEIGVFGATRAVFYSARPEVIKM